MRPSLPRLVFAGLSLFVLALLAGAASPPEFESWPQGKSPAEIGRRVAERYLARPYNRVSYRGQPIFALRAPASYLHCGPVGGPYLPAVMARPELYRPAVHIIYPEVITWYGSLSFAQRAGRTEIAEALVKRFEPLADGQSIVIPKVTEVDFAVFGAVPLEIARYNGDPRCLRLGLRIAREQWMPPAPQHLLALAPEPRAIAVQAFRDGLTWHTRYWIDDMYMITLVQTQAFRASGERVFIDRAARAMVSYLDRLQRPNGLFWHAPDVPFFWGRGNGWVAAGMAELLASLPEDHRDRPRILAGYRLMMASLLACQTAEGVWRQLLDKPESWPETSGTGMFTFAFIMGVKHGWLDAATYAPAARKAWLRLTDYIDQDAGLREVCVGTNKRNDYQYYLDRPRSTGDLHGQAPLLWCATALLAEK